MTRIRTLANDKKIAFRGPTVASENTKSSAFMSKSKLTGNMFAFKKIRDIDSSVIVTADSYVRYSSIEHAAADTNYGTETSLFLTGVPVPPSQQEFARSFVYADLTAYLGIAISHADFRVEFANILNLVGNDTTVDLHEVAASWGELTVTWNNQPAAGAFVNDFVLTAYGWYLVDCTALVQAWLSGAKTNNGLVMTWNKEVLPPPGQFLQATFYSRENIRDDPSFELTFA